MLNSSQFRDWCLKLQFRESTREQIQQIRSSPPSRRVQSRRGNVSGRYPSQKMGVTIQFESHLSGRLLSSFYRVRHANI
ncbi:hypothetical protein H1P_5220001 [Hyella patelloides LEGE 07179]|uniref:Uncharacterized protein n=1 Tax=Hyella patelloides LEGE 07179 TaxID=945734 RepID=A0A563VZY4_9CYAN|nr:hypothetical protein [Hyella patelloides]VEP17001.1 hypothetical protein H1P_5220001 [Hyella patelloides LEGE 07179]